MPDISHTLTAKSQQLNAGDLAAPLVVTGRRVRVTQDDQPVTIDIGDDLQPWKPCKGMRRLLARTWGTDTDSWPGHRVELFNDPIVRWAGAAVGGVRVAAISGISRPTVYTMRTSQKGTQQYQIRPLERAAEIDPDAAREKFAAYAKAKGGSRDDVAAFLEEQGTSLADLSADDLRVLARDLDSVREHAAAARG